MCLPKKCVHPNFMPGEVRKYFELNEVGVMINNKYDFYGYI